MVLERTGAPNAFNSASTRVNSSHEMDGHVQRIITWRESLAKMPDNHFFELVRMYLGEVKTPYNKQKLIEELGNFFRKDENRRMLVKLLSDADVCVITAVFAIPSASQKKLTAFFQGMFPFAGLYERLLNLEERLILYRILDLQTSEMVFAVNPMLEDILLPFADLNFLLPPAQVDSMRTELSTDCIYPDFSERPSSSTSPHVNDSQPFPLSQQFLGAFIAFAAKNPGMCKAEGSLKKRTGSLLQQAFPQCHNHNIFVRLVFAFKNLSLFTINDDGITVNYSKIEKFAELQADMQYMFLAAAAVDYRSRADIYKYAQLLFDMSVGIPQTGFTRQVLVRSAFLIRAKNELSLFSTPKSTVSRFAELLKQGGGLSESPQADQSDAVVGLIENARLFGIFKTVFAEEYGENVFFSNLETLNSPLVSDGKLASIDAGFSITILPGLSLLQLIQLERFMDLSYFDTITSLEITRQSCFRAFDKGIKEQQILDALENAAMHEIPQNLIFSIHDWAKAFSSVSMFFGYVMKVDEDKVVLVKNNKILGSHISTMLAPGVFLLDFATPSEAAAIIERSGLDFIGTTKTAKENINQIAFASLSKSEMPFPVLSELIVHKTNGTDSTSMQVSSVKAPVKKSSSIGQEKMSMTRADENERADLFNSLRDSLESLDLPKDQKDGLLARINRKIVLNPVQLRGDSVKMEKLEAGGMDFQGKVHVIEQAIASASMIEIATEDDKVLVGSPINIEKKEEDANVQIRIEPLAAIEVFSIGKARHVRRIRGSIFSEPGI